MMLEMKDEFDCLVDHARRKAHPSIRIGIQQRRAISIAPELLKRFMEEYPDVEIIFRDGNQEELAARFSYDPEADLEYTPDSVFCSHGAGYPVKWHQAREHMHLKVSLP